VMRHFGVVETASRAAYNPQAFTVVEREPSSGGPATRKLSFAIPILSLAVGFC